MGRVVRDVPNMGKLSEIGKIKIGDKKLNQAGKEFPISLDYFRATGNFSSNFYEVFPENTNKIPVFFHSDDIDEVCNEEYVIRDKSGKLVATGDGKVWKVYNKDSEKYDQVNLTMEQALKLGIAKLTLTLRFLIPKIPVIGLWRFETRGEASSIPQVRDTFDYVQAQAGSIVNIPFDLVVTKVKSQKPGVASQYSVVALIPNLGKKHVEMLHDFYQQGNRANKLLTANSIEQLLLAEAPAEAKQSKIESDVVEFEDIPTTGSSELEQVVDSMRACADMNAVIAHWKEWSKTYGENELYVKAKDEMKLKFKK